MNLKRDNVQCMYMLNIDSPIVKEANIFNVCLQTTFQVSLYLLTNHIL